jgi:hypothetical protein
VLSYCYGLIRGVLPTMYRIRKTGKEALEPYKESNSIYSRICFKLSRSFLIRFPVAGCVSGNHPTRSTWPSHDYELTPGKKSLFSR